MLNIYWLANSDGRTIGGRLRFTHVITHLLSQRLGDLVEGNKRKAHEKHW